MVHMGINFYSYYQIMSALCIMSVSTGIYLDLLASRAKDLIKKEERKISATSIEIAIQLIPLMVLSILGAVTVGCFYHPELEPKIRNALPLSLADSALEYAFIRVAALGGVIASLGLKGLMTVPYVRRPARVLDFFFERPALMVGTGYTVYRLFSPLGGIMLFGAGLGSDALDWAMHPEAYKNLRRIKVVKKPFGELTLTGKVYRLANDYFWTNAFLGTAITCAIVPDSWTLSTSLTVSQLAYFSRNRAISYKKEYLFDKASLDLLTLVFCLNQGPFSQLLTATTLYYIFLGFVQSCVNQRTRSYGPEFYHLPGI